MVVDLAGEVRIRLLRGLEHDFGAIGELVGGEVDFAEGAFAYELAEGVVADGDEVGRGELGQEGLVGVGELCMRWSVGSIGRRVGCWGDAPCCVVAAGRGRPESSAA